MGYGDAIMATAEARYVYEQTGHKVAFGSEKGIHCDPVFDNNPYIARDGEQGIRIPNYPGCRPYIHGRIGDRWIWKDYRPRPGDLFFTPDEERAVDYLVRDLPTFVAIEPNVMDKGWATNKDWGRERYQAVVNDLKADVAFVQIGQGPGLEDVTRLHPGSFRLAAGVLMHAQLYLGPEGGLHHAAAAVDTDAVVIFGAYIHPENTGYETHHNIKRGERPLGSIKPCPECRAALDSITVEEVADAVAGRLALL